MPLLHYLVSIVLLVIIALPMDAVSALYAVLESFHCDHLPLAQIALSVNLVHPPVLPHAHHVLLEILPFLDQFRAQRVLQDIMQH